MTLIMSSFAGGPDKPILINEAYGKFRISNFDPDLDYSFSCTSGTAAFTDDSGQVTMSGSTSICTVLARYAPGSAPSIGATHERRAYTYHSGGQTCNDNCMPGGGPGGEGDCWCGYRAGDLCCGGCYGQTCTDNPPIKDSTPSGFTDIYGEWVKNV